MQSKLHFTGASLLAISIFFGAVFGQTENVCEQGNSVSFKFSETVSAQTKIVQLVDFSGQGTDEIFPSGEKWQPFGPYRTIIVTDKQKIVGFGSAVFGTRSGTVRVTIGLCYMKDKSPQLTALAGENHLIVDVDASRRTFAVSASTTLPAGKYAVGYCVINRGSQPIDNNDYVNGWVMVTN